MAEINDLNVVDDSNTARFPENMPPSDVNDNERALEGILARWHKDTNGSTVTTGSANAYAFAANQTFSAYYDGMDLTFDANFTNTGAATLNVDSLGAKSILKNNDVALAAGDIEAGQKVRVVYDGTSFQMLSPVATTTDSSGGLSNIVEDTTPQLGGTLDTNSQQIRWSKGADIASASNLVPGTDGNYFDVTGTTDIDTIATMAVGTVIKLHFDDILTLNYDATNLVLPGGGNITTAAGDEAELFEYATADWRMTSYSPTANIPSSQAVQADIEAETNEDSYIPPDLLVFNPGVAKAWGYVDRSAGTPSLSSPSQNVTSVTDDGPGKTIITLDTNMSSAIYAPVANDIGGGGVFTNTNTLSAGSFKVTSFTPGENPATYDIGNFTFCVFGDFA